MSQPSKQPEATDWRPNPIVAIVIGVLVAYIVETILGLMIQSFIQTIAWIGSFFMSGIIGTIFGLAYYERSFIRGIARLLVPFYLGRVGGAHRNPSSSVAQVWGSAIRGSAILKESGVESIRPEEYEEYKREMSETIQPDRGVISTVFSGAAQVAKHEAEQRIIDSKTGLAKSRAELAKARTEKVRAELELKQAEMKKVEEVIIEERRRTKEYYEAERGWQESERELKKLQEQWKREDEEIKAFVGESLERAQALNKLLQAKHQQMEEVRKANLPAGEKRKQLRIIEQYYDLQLAQMGIMLSQPQPSPQGEEWL